MDVFKSFLNKPFIKTALLGITTLVIGGLCSALGAWDSAQDIYFKKKLVALIISVVLYIILLAFYATYETNMKKITMLYEKQNKAFEDTMSGLLSICKLSADGANGVIHEIIDKSEANLDIWSFDKSCYWICKKMYDLLCIIGNGKEFEVIYNRLDEKEKPEKYVYVNAYANKDMERPSIYNIRRSIECDNYHDVELFKNNQAETEIILGYEKIDEVFGHKTKEKRKINKKKYNQYVAIPIFCKDDKMIGLIEIVCFNKTAIAIIEPEIREIVSKYFRPYAFLALVLHKLEKALIARPQIQRQVQ